MPVFVPTIVEGQIRKYVFQSPKTGIGGAVKALFGLCFSVPIWAFFDIA